MVKNSTSVDSSYSHLQTITSLLIVLFCLFKSECYYTTQYTATASSRPACELVLPTLPWDSIPQLIEHKSSGNEAVPVAIATYPLNVYLFSVLQQKYALFVSTRLHLYGNRTSVICLHRQPHLFKFFHTDSSGDIPFSFFS